MKNSYLRMMLCGAALGALSVTMPADAFAQGSGAPPAFEGRGGGGHGGPPPSFDENAKGEKAGQGGEEQGRRPPPPCGGEGGKAKG
ncbi:MAG TPA: hypothetical protein PLW48_11600 [Alphaproteobacteria bacterium]|nr:hypothetical protein [Alphaproteobacteria bacterium]